MCPTYYYYVGYYKIIIIMHMYYILRYLYLYCIHTRYYIVRVYYYLGIYFCTQKFSPPNNTLLFSFTFSTFILRKRQSYT